MRLQLLLTGNELMSGDTVDSNSAMIATRLGAVGYPVDRKVTVGDDLDMLVAEINAMAATSDVLIVNGGLGPTVDDLTALALSRVVGRPLAEHPEAMSELQAWCERLGFALNDANRKQAILPEGVTVVRNPIGSAPGFAIEHDACLIICTPGVPRELSAMLDGDVLAAIQHRFPRADERSTLRLKLFGIGESSLQQWLTETVADWPAAVELGFRANFPLLELKLTVRRHADEVVREQCLETIRSMLGDYVIGPNDTTMAQAVVEILTERGLHLTTAESCTGGLIASMLTGVAGASAVYEAGFVAYSNAIKSAVLGVDDAALARDGAVSETVVRQMAAGALQRSGAEFAVAVSGIAGPTGGTNEKPVGTVWLGWGDRNRIDTRQLLVRGNRGYFQQLTATIALDLVRRRLLGCNGEPRYFTDRAPPRR